MLTQRPWVQMALKSKTIFWRVNLQLLIKIAITTATIISSFKYVLISLVGIVRRKLLLKEGHI